MGHDSTLSSECFAGHLREILRNLYDDPYLAKHPITGVLFPDFTGESHALSKTLRMWILDGIEALRPENGTPRASGAWRPYHILQARYVESCTTAEVMRRIGLAHSHYYDQHRMALAHLTSALYERYLKGAQPTALPATKRSLLRQEIRRLSGKQDHHEVDFVTVLQDVLTLFGPIIRERGLTLSYDPASMPSLPKIPLDIVLVRQLLVQLLGSAFRLAATGEFAVTWHLGNSEIVVVFGGASPHQRSRWLMVQHVTLPLCSEQMFARKVPQISGASG